MITLRVVCLLNNFFYSEYFQKTDQQNTILTELYDSLDKKSPPSRMDLDSLEVNLNNQYNIASDSEPNKNLFDSLEVNVWSMNKNAALQVENVLKKQVVKRQAEEVFIIN